MSQPCDDSAFDPPPDSEAFYAESLRLLNESRIPFLLSGTYAVTAYTGISRPTKDLDVFCKAGDFPKILAFFQARGVGSLFSAALAPEGGLVLPPLPRSSTDSSPKPSARTIQERNPFDSVTGPLFAEGITLPESQKPTLDVSDPLSAPVCPGVKVLILTESDVPTWSFAAIQGPGDSHPTLRRVGDKVGDVLQMPDNKARLWTVRMQ